MGNKTENVQYDVRFPYIHLNLSNCDNFITLKRIIASDLQTTVRLETKVHNVGS